MLVWWPRAPEPARHPRAVHGCTAPMCPRPGSGGSTPRRPRLPRGASPVLRGGCVGGGVWREPTPGPRRHRPATSQGPRQSLRLKGPMGEAATRATSLLANSQHLCHSKSGCKLSQIQPTTQSPQNPRALCIHLPADPETPDKPSVYTAIFQEDLSS